MELLYVEVCCLDPLPKLAKCTGASRSGERNARVSQIGAIRWAMIWRQSSWLFNHWASMASRRKALRRTFRCISLSRDLHDQWSAKFLHWSRHSLLQKQLAGNYLAGNTNLYGFSSLLSKQKLPTARSARAAGPQSNKATARATAKGSCQKSQKSQK